MSKKIVIIGAGPAGLSTAYKLTTTNHKYDIEIIEQGKRIENRSCCQNAKVCNPCDILAGVGGAGGYSDGKLNLHESIGGRLSYFQEENLDSLVQQVYASIYSSNAQKPFSEVPHIDKEQQKLVEFCAQHKIKYIPIKQKHIGTDNLPALICKLTERLENSGIKLSTSEAVLDIDIKNNKVQGLTTDKRYLLADYIIICTGRTGNNLVRTICEANKIPYIDQEIDVGIRIEFQNEIFQEILKYSYDPKFVVYLDNDKKVRTFCTNPGGFVVSEKYLDFVSVNGHAFSNKKSSNTNLAILYTMKTNSREPKLGIQFENIAKNIALDSNNKVILQTYDDLKQKRRTEKKRHTYSPHT